MKYILFYIFFIAALAKMKAQVNDSIRKAYVSDSITAKKNLRKAIYSKVRKATIMSACLPGLGQVYNKKYWKTPIILGVIGGLTYWGINNQKQYKFYQKNLVAENDDNSKTINTTGLTSEFLLSEMKDYKKNRDIAIFAGVAAYILNIIDANVDAHLNTFDVSDDLSLQINPYSNLDLNNNFYSGLCLKLNFK